MVLLQTSPKNTNPATRTSWRGFAHLRASLRGRGSVVGWRRGVLFFFRTAANDQHAGHQTTQHSQQSETAHPLLHEKSSLIKVVQVTASISVAFWPCKRSIRTKVRHQSLAT